MAGLPAEKEGESTLDSSTLPIVLGHSSQNGYRVPLTDIEIHHAFNSVLHPKPTLSSSYKDWLPESNVENSLELLHSLESIGIKEDVAAPDEEQIAKFRESIEFRDGAYYVDLPWNEDLIKDMPSNFDIASAIAWMVHENNARKGLRDAYLDAFREQEEAGIIEQIPDGYDVTDHVFIPNRAVFKPNPQASTKVRPVFNCSLKIRGSPSLNEAAFPSTDLMPH